MTRFASTSRRPNFRRHFHSLVAIPTARMSFQGCWHLPAGGDDDWLCVDVPRGLRMGLDTLPSPGRKTPLNGGETRQGVGDGDAVSNPTGENDAATSAVAAASTGLDEGKEGEGGVREGKGGASDDKMREVSLVSPLNLHIYI